MNKILKILSVENKNLLILGDFNINLLNIDTDNECQSFLDITSSNLLTPLILKPTRFTTKGKTLIDNIFTNLLVPCKSGDITCSISDHLPQFAILDINPTSCYNKETIKYKRDYSTFIQENFILEFLETEWDKILEYEKNDPDLSISKLIEGITKILDNHAPIKKLKQKNDKSNNKPWISAGILKSIKKKHNLYKNFIKEKQNHKKNELQNQFKQYRNILTNILKISKNNYCNKYFAEHKNNLKKAWAGIKDVINIKKQNENIPKTMKIDGNENNNPQNIADSFNKFFGTVATKTKAKIIKTDRKYTDYLKNPNKKSIFMKPTKITEIRDIILSLDNAKATGPGSIPTNILKILLPHMSYIISKIINISFNTGIFPDSLKFADIVPVYKKDSKLQVENYRPISLLSNISKIFEKTIHTRLYKFLEKTKCIYNFQFGFRSKHKKILQQMRKLYDNKNLAAI